MCPVRCVAAVTPTSTYGLCTALSKSPGLRMRTDALLGGVRDWEAPVGDRLTEHSSFDTHPLPQRIK